MRWNTLAPVVLFAALSPAACDRAPTTPSAAGASSVTAASTNQLPVAQIKLQVLNAGSCSFGANPCSYVANASTSYDPDGSIVQYEWFENGTNIGTGPSLSFSALRAYNPCATSPSSKTRVYLTVTDNLGATGSACLEYTPF
jgi:hypothetical protein